MLHKLNDTLDELAASRLQFTDQRFSTQKLKSMDVFIEALLTQISRLNEAIFTKLKSPPRLVTMMFLLIYV